jgi:hypothetical protein
MEEQRVCRPVICKTCNKVTWAGCGMHVEQVLAGFPSSERCAGHPDSPRQGLLGRLLKRR